MFTLTVTKCFSMKADQVMTLNYAHGDQAAIIQGWKDAGYHVSV